MSISKVLRVLALLLAAPLVWSQGNGKLQIHFIDVGQADGAILISPGGQVAAFDIGQDVVRKDCTKAAAYYDQLGLTKLDYLFISHYHQDHIGCVPAVLESRNVANAEDRGSTYASSFYTNYAKAVQSVRHTASAGQKFVLDETSAHPVTLKVYAVNANGQKTSNENDLSLALTISYGGFRAEIGGDLSGDNTANYIDVESGVAPQVGKLDVYKVHHHCSSHSSNQTWMDTTKPTVAIISDGDNNRYGHPAEDCLERLHSAGTKTYWTEQGVGTPAPGWDVVAGTTVVTVNLDAGQFTVQHGSTTDTYTIAGATPPSDTGAGTTTTTTSQPTSYSWSKNSKIYHYSNCDWVKTISADNLQTGTEPPNGRKLHKGCPTQH